MFPLLSLLSLSLPLLALVRAESVSVSFPPNVSFQHVVQSNFMGVSIELSYIDLYIGKTPSTLPTPSVNYFNALRPGNGNPLRVRIGGNSMDSSSLDPNQSVILHVIDPNANSNDVPTTFGPILFDTLNAFSDAIGGSTFMMGLSLRVPNGTNNTLLTQAAEKKLGSRLDVLLLGNEPDLYTNHGNRPGITNYTTKDYFDDFQTVEGLLENSSSGNLLSSQVIGGPTICCNWDLNSVISDGYLKKFSDQLKYVTLQHYPQNNCQGTPKFGVEYYVQHQNAVALAQWNNEGAQNAIMAGKPMVMTEFNTASCGGIPGISDTFAAAFWTVDYALQLASLGYTAAYIHTREPDVTYTFFYTTDGNPNGTYTTRPSYYGMPVMMAALTPSQPGTGGSVVVDLNIDGSTSKNSTSSGYAIYDKDSLLDGPNRLILFNNGGESGSQTLSYHIEAAQFGKFKNGTAPSPSVRVGYLTAPSITETANISWNGLTLNGVGDGKFVATSDSFIGSKTVSMECESGCDIQVPAPGVAVVWLNPQLDASSSSGPSNNGSGTGNNSGGQARFPCRSWARMIAVMAGSLLMILFSTMV